METGTGSEGDKVMPRNHVSAKLADRPLDECVIALDHLKSMNATALMAIFRISDKPLRRL